MENLVPTSILERESVKALRRKLEERISDPQKQRLIVLVIVSTALLLDNMLYMVIVPIMPEYLRVTGAFDEQQYVWANRSQAQGPGPSTPKAAAQDGMLKSAMGWVARVNRDDELESVALGFLFASKALVQLCVSPIAGTIMDHVGYDLPMVRLFFALLLPHCHFSCALLRAGVRTRRALRVHERLRDRRRLYGDAGRALDAGRRLRLRRHVRPRDDRRPLFGREATPQGARHRARVHLVRLAHRASVYASLSLSIPFQIAVTFLELY